MKALIITLVAALVVVASNAAVVVGWAPPDAYLVLGYWINATHLLTQEGMYYVQQNATVYGTPSELYVFQQYLSHVCRFVKVVPHRIEEGVVVGDLYCSQDGRSWAPLWLAQYKISTIRYTGRVELQRCNCTVVTPFGNFSYVVPTLWYAVMQDFRVLTIIPPNRTGEIDVYLSYLAVQEELERLKNAVSSAYAERTELARSIDVLNQKVRDLERALGVKDAEIVHLRTTIQSLYSALQKETDEKQRLQRELQTCRIRLENATSEVTKLRLEVERAYALINNFEMQLEEAAGRGDFFFTLFLASIFVAIMMLVGAVLYVRKKLYE